MGYQLAPAVIIQTVVKFAYKTQTIIIFNKKYLKKKLIFFHSNELAENRNVLSFQIQMQI